MTREEAANILSNDIIDGHVEGNARFMDAFWFAVDNLKAEPCEDAVSREAVLEITAETGALETQSRVKALPPVTPKQRTGKWIFKNGAYTCECGCRESNRTNYCPNCGAKMEGVSE